jgi:hypothetical protein
MRKKKLTGTGARAASGERRAAGLATSSFPSYAAGPPDFEENDRFCEGCPTGMGQAVRNGFPLDFGVPDPEGGVSNDVVRMTPPSGGGYRGRSTRKRSSSRSTT